MLTGYSLIPFRDPRRGAHRVLKQNSGRSTWNPRTTRRSGQWRSDTFLDPRKRIPSVAPRREHRGGVHLPAGRPGRSAGIAASSLSVNAKDGSFPFVRTHMSPHGLCRAGIAAIFGRLTRFTTSPDRIWANNKRPLPAGLVIPTKWFSFQLMEGSSSRCVIVIFVRRNDAPPRIQRSYTFYFTFSS